MKKLSTKTMLTDDNGVLAEYDFRGGVRGKHYKALKAGYTITIYKPDGTTVFKDLKPREGTVVLEPDVQEYFPDSESVNAALRSLISLIPTKNRTTEKKAWGARTRRRVTSSGRSRSARKKA